MFYTISTSHIAVCCTIRAVSTTFIFSEFVEEKNRTCIFLQAGDKELSLALSLSLSLSLSVCVCVCRKTELARVIEPMFILP